MIPEVINAKTAQLDVVNANQQQIVQHVKMDIG